jgi:hypothetical protein
VKKLRLVLIVVPLYSPSFAETLSAAADNNQPRVGGSVSEKGGSFARCAPQSAGKHRVRV